MKMHVRIRTGDEIFALQQRFFKLIGSLLKLGKLGICDVIAGILHSQLLQSGPDLQHILHILTGDLGNLRSLSRDHQYQSLQLQFPDCLTDRCPAHAQLIGQLNLHQSLSRFQFPF